MKYDTIEGEMRWLHMQRQLFSLNWQTDRRTGVWPYPGWEEVVSSKAGGSTDRTFLRRYLREKQQHSSTAQETKGRKLSIVRTVSALFHRSVQKDLPTLYQYKCKVNFITTFSALKLSKWIVSTVFGRRLRSWSEACRRKNSVISCINC